MFKRIFALILILASAACAAGCGGSGGHEAATEPPAPSAAQTEAAQTAEAATEPSRTEAPGEQRFCVLDKRCDTSGGHRCAAFETDDAYYYLCSDGLGGNYEIWFSDKEYKDWMPLCGKPDCMHMGPGCNAMLEGDAEFAFWPYGDHIYYLLVDRNAPRPYVGAELWRMKLDGSDHELVLKPELPHSTDLESVMSAGSGVEQSMNFDFTGKYAIINYSVSGLTNDGVLTGKHVNDRYMIDLSRPEEGAVLLEFTDDAGEPIPFYGVLFGKGDTVYSLGFDIALDPETETSVVANAAMYVFDIPARRGRKLCDLDFDPSDLFRSENDGTLYFASGFIYGQKKEVYAVDLETGEVEKTFERNGERLFWTFPYRQYIFGFGANYDPTQNTFDYGVCVYSMKGELLQQRAFAEGESRVECFAFVGDCAFGTLMSSDPEYDEDAGFTKPPTWYLDLNDLGTDELRWRKWEP